MATEISVLDYFTTERLELFSRAYRQYPVLWDPTHPSHYRKVAAPQPAPARYKWCAAQGPRRGALARLAAALGEARGRGVAARLGRLCRRFLYLVRRQLEKACKKVVKRHGADKLTAAHARARLPPWAAHADSYLHVADVVVATYTKKPKEREETPPVPEEDVEPEVEAVYTASHARRVVGALRRAALAPPPARPPPAGPPTATPGPPAPGPGGPSPPVVAAAARALHESISTVNDIWTNLRTISLRKLRALIRRGDSYAAIPAASRLSALEWAAADLMVYHGYSVLREEHFTLYAPLNALLATFHLVQRHGLEPRDVTSPRAWTRAAARYSAQQATVACSGVVLQKRWHELKDAARRALRDAFYRRGPPPPPLLQAVARRYPHVVTREPTPWAQLVAEGRVAAPTNENGPMPGSVLLEDFASDGSADEDDLILVEKNIETIVLDDDDSDQQKSTVAITQTNDKPSLDDQLESLPKKSYDVHVKEAGSEINSLGVEKEMTDVEPSSDADMIQSLREIDVNDVQMTIHFDDDDDDFNDNELNDDATPNASEMQNLLNSNKKTFSDVESAGVVVENVNTNKCNATSDVVDNSLLRVRDIISTQVESLINMSVNEIANEVSKSNTSNNQAECRFRSESSDSDSMNLVIDHNYAKSDVDIEENNSKQTAKQSANVNKRSLDTNDLNKVKPAGKDDAFNCKDTIHEDIRSLNPTPVTAIVSDLLKSVADETQGNLSSTDNSKCSVRCSGSGAVTDKERAKCHAASTMSNKGAARSFIHSNHEPSKNTNDGNSNGICTENNDVIEIDDNDEGETPVDGTASIQIENSTTPDNIVGGHAIRNPILLQMLRSQSNDLKRFHWFNAIVEAKWAKNAGEDVETDPDENDDSSVEDYFGEIDPKLIMYPIVVMTRLELPKMRRDSRHIRHSYHFDPTLSPKFVFKKENLALLRLCRPCVVVLERLDLERGESGGGNRVAKKVELPDIEEVRRINKKILTAQVAPITIDVDECESRRARTAAAPARPEEDDISTEDLRALLNDLASSAECPGRACPGCAGCTARRLLPPAGGRGAAAEQRRLLRRGLYRHENRPAKSQNSDKKRVADRKRKAPARAAAAPYDPEQAQRQWLLERNFAAEKFGIKPRSYKKKPIPETRSEPATITQVSSTPAQSDLNCLERMEGHFTATTDNTHDFTITPNSSHSSHDTNVQVILNHAPSTYLPLSEENLRQHAKDQPIYRLDSSLFNPNAVADINKKLGDLATDAPETSEQTFLPVITSVQSLATKQPPKKQQHPPVILMDEIISSMTVAHQTPGPSRDLPPSRNTKERARNKPSKVIVTIKPSNANKNMLSENKLSTEDIQAKTATDASRARHQLADIMTRPPKPPVITPAQSSKLSVLLSNPPRPPLHVNSVQAGASQSNSTAQRNQTSERSLLIGKQAQKGLQSGGTITQRAQDSQINQPNQVNSNTQYSYSTNQQDSVSNQQTQQNPLSQINSFVDNSMTQQNSVQLMMPNHQSNTLLVSSVQAPQSNILVSPPTYTPRLGQQAMPLNSVQAGPSNSLLLGSSFDSPLLVNMPQITRGGILAGPQFGSFQGDMSQTTCLSQLNIQSCPPQATQLQTVPTSFQAAASQITYQTQPPRVITVHARPSPVTQTVPSQVPLQAGSAQVGLAQASLAQVGLAQIVSAQAGSAQVGLAQVGPAQVGVAQAGLGQVYSPQASSAQAISAQSNAAQAGLAQASLAQVGLAQIVSAQASSAQVGLAQVGPAQVGVAQAGLGQVYSPQAGSAQVGLAQASLAQVGLAQIVSAQAGSAQVGLAQVGVAQAGLGQANAAQASLAQADSAQANSALSSLAQAGSAQAGLAQANMAHARQDVATHKKPSRDGDFYNGRMIVTSALPALRAAAYVRGRDPTTLAVLAGPWPARRHLLLQEASDASGPVFGLTPPCRLLLQGEDDAPSPPKLPKPAPAPEAPVTSVDPAEPGRKSWLKVRSFAKMADDSVPAPAQDGPPEPSAAGERSAPAKVYLDNKVYQKLCDKPLTYAKVLKAVSSIAECRELVSRRAPLVVYAAVNTHLYPVRGELTPEGVALFGPKEIAEYLHELAAALARTPRTKETEDLEGIARKIDQRTKEAWGSRDTGGPKVLNRQTKKRQVSDAQTYSMLLETPVIDLDSDDD